MFLDGAELITPAVEARIDEIARQVPGFFIGRFDVRYASLEAFRRGDDLAIVELNGVTSESTNIYDPDYGAVAGVADPGPAVAAGVRDRRRQPRPRRRTAESATVAETDPGLSARRPADAHI